MPENIKREKRVPLRIRVIESLKSDIESVAKKEKATTTEVSEAWLLVGQKHYRSKNDTN